VISSVRGTVTSISAPAGAHSHVVIEVGGVGLLVQVTSAQALVARAGSPMTLLTALIVREDDLALYGFAEAGELMAFDLLRGVTGVGPRSALAVLAVLSPSEIARAVTADDDAVFRRVSGIGPKTAKLIVLSLTGKLAGMSGDRPTPISGTAIGTEVVLALVGLGWPERVATQAVEAALEQADDRTSSDLPALLRLVLATLGRRQATEVSS